MMDIDIFIPCFIDQMYPETAMNMVKVLEKAGCRVHYNRNQTCCGQPAYNAGYFDEAMKLAKKFLEDFSGERYIVSPSGSCIGMVKHAYKYFFGNSALRSRHNKIAGKSYEFTQFLIHVLKKDDFGARFDAKVCYHDACSALRGLSVKNEPRQLLKKVQGLSLLEMSESETCCGFGGTFSVKMEAISIGMAEQKIENALHTGAEYIVSTETSCLMHLEAYCRKNKKDIGTMHIADVLAQGY
jgi:L-lactate dehydrogenase complex protein LldE